ncbi:Asp23/Gls24 family envelope stress response protein [Pseudonocardia alni]|uniref:Asp23/Gls24 family envelope stress response protein n=1 Tax=Pseudonocardia alni TaxID=33907 RepID=UPI0033282F42
MTDHEHHHGRRGGDRTGPTATPDGHRDQEFLVCGTSIDTLLTQVADGRGPDRDAHQENCVHCQAALAEYDRLWSPLRDLAAQQVTAPAGSMEAALARIRSAIDDSDYAALRGADGTTRIAARVVVAAARYSAESVPGVRVALSRDLSGHREAGSEITAGVAGASTALEITLAADYGRPLHQLAADVRRAVVTKVRHLTDLEPVEVTVIIDDVFTEP